MRRSRSRVSPRQVRRRRMRPPRWQYVCACLPLYVKICVKDERTSPRRRRLHELLVEQRVDHLVGGSVAELRCVEECSGRAVAGEQLEVVTGSAGDGDVVAPVAVEVTRDGAVGSVVAPQEVEEPRARLVEEPAEVLPLPPDRGDVGAPVAV